MRTANPALNDKTFERYVDYAAQARMTLSGTVNKTGFLLFILIVPAVWIWQQVYEASGAVNVQGWMIGGIVGGLVMAIVTVFKPTWSPITAPMYAALQGLALGGISAFFEQRYPGIVIQAIALTFGTLAVLLMAYTTGVIKATENFKLGVASATGAVFLVYLVTMVMGFFGVSVPFIHEGGLIGIIFSLVVVVIAALNLVLDFDFIETGVERGAPKFMEWYAGFGLMVTLVWLYLEILRLLAKLQSRR
jgi:uncharacterized YccA/Bax inhibitor family protein